MARLRRCGAEIGERRFLISCRMDGLSDLINRQIGHARRQAGATFKRRGIGVGKRFAIGMVGLGDVAPTAGSAIAATARDIIIRPGPRLVWVPHVQVVTVVVVPDNRQANIKRPKVNAKSSGWEGRKNNGGECGNPKDNADRPHDLEPYEALKDSVRIPLNVAFVPLVPMDGEVGAERRRRALGSDRTQPRVSSCRAT